jgi:peptidoglycan hydrolase-like protein with peptidoglycan-binding domain
MMNYLLNGAFERGLFKGSKHAEVKLLQNFLIAEGFLASGNSTGFFGQLTESSVKVYQCKLAIICTGTSNTTGWGVTGPKTRARLKQGSTTASDTERTSVLQEQLRTLQQQIEGLKKR